jgi:signal transduction histidine kinase
MVISGASELLKMGDLTEKQIDYLNKILSASKRSALLVKKLLNFSKNLELVSFNLLDVVKDSIEIINFTNKKEAKVYFISGLSSVNIYGDSNLVSNAIINLIKNGIEASNQFCDIYVSLTSVTLLNPLKKIVYGEFSVGDYYKLEIKDFGEGISELEIEKIFKPFYSTKDLNGTGLGLSNVITAVKAFNGILTLDSTVKIGSIFTIYFRK